MNRFTHTKSLFIAGSAVALVVGLTGCGGGGGGGSKSSAATTTSAASSIVVAASSTPASTPTEASSTPASAAGSSTPIAASSTPTSSSVATSSVAASSTPTSSSTASTNILASVIKNDGGLFGYKANAGVINRRALIGSAAETYESYNGSAFVAASSSDANYAFVLNADGWVRGKNEYKVASFNEDGTVTTINATDWDIGNTLYVDEEIDLTGRNVQAFLNAYLNTNEMLGAVNPTATFGAGAKAFFVEHQNDAPIYSIYVDEGRDDGKCWWEGGDPISDSGGNCMKVDMTVDANMLEKAVSGYAKLFSPDVAVNTAGYRAVILGQVGPNNLDMQVINDAQKTVKFYENLPNGNFTRLLGTSTWSEMTLPYLTTDNKALHVELPNEVKIHLAAQGTTEVTYAQQNGHLRPVSIANRDDEDEEMEELEEGIDGENISFNATANTDITASTIDYKNPLVGNWKLDGDIFIFSDNNTFSHVKSINDDPNCQVGSATGTYSWNPITSILHTEIKADSTGAEAEYGCSVEGKLKIALTASTLVLMVPDEGDYTFTKSTSSTGLVGSWILRMGSQFTIITFTETGYFLADYDSSETDDAPTYGTESGTYIYSAGSLYFTVVSDTNGTRGFSDGVDSSTPWPIVFSGDGDSFTIGDGLTVNRLK